MHTIYAESNLVKGSKPCFFWFIIHNLRCRMIWCLEWTASEEINSKAQRHFLRRWKSTSWARKTFGAFIRKIFSTSLPLKNTKKHSCHTKCMGTKSTRVKINTTKDIDAIGGWTQALTALIISRLKKLYHNTAGTATSVRQNVSVSSLSVITRFVYSATRIFPNFFFPFAFSNFAKLSILVFKLFITWSEENLICSRCSQNCLGLISNFSCRNYAGSTVRRNHQKHNLLTLQNIEVVAGTGSVFARSQQTTEDVLFGAQETAGFVEPRTHARPVLVRLALRGGLVALLDQPDLFQDPDQQVVHLVVYGGRHLDEFAVVVLRRRTALWNKTQGVLFGFP